jgi:tripartite-type tricarboxylate transporter receptor subunit TctC
MMQDRARWIAKAGILALAAFAMPLATAAAQDLSFKDRQIRLVVGSAPGGGYDTYARLLAAHWRKHIPGNPTIVVQNMPGAGSLVAANHLFNVAPKDGTVLGGVNPLVATEPLFYPDRAKFDPRQFQWVGSALRETHTGLAWHTSPVQSFNDTFKQELVVAGTGGTTNLYPVFVNALLGTRFKMIPGYNGTKMGMLAMERGEVSGNVGITWASLKATNADWLRDEKIRVFVQFGLKKHRELPNAAWIFDYARNPDDRAAMNLVFGTSEFGRPYLAPPGVPEPIVAMLRQAFDATMKDSEFLEEAQRRSVDVEPTGGADIQALTETMFHAPPAVVERVKSILDRTPTAQ